MVVVILLAGGEDLQGELQLDHLPHALVLEHEVDRDALDGELPYESLGENDDSSKRPIIP